MTEIEAISKIQWRINTASEIAGRGEDGKAFEDLEMAIQALEEIQEYRAIGLTPSMVKDLIKSCKRHEKNALENAHIVDDYREIGTVEEFKALKEKNEPKKPIRDKEFSSLFECPTCGRRQKIMYEQYHCKECGQRLDWQ